MPYLFAIYLSDFLEDVNQGDGKKVASLLEDFPCEKCRAKELHLTREKVRRAAVTLTGISSILVPLAVCGSCGSRRRVLPIELLPGKSYSVPVIEQFVSTYLSSPRGLRSTVKHTEGSEYKPHFTTLHGWCGGLGERVLDQVRLQRHRAAIDSAPDLPPFRGTHPRDPGPHRGPGAQSVFA